MPLFDDLESQYRERQVEFFTLSIWPEEFDPAVFLRDHKMSSTFLIVTMRLPENTGFGTANLFRD
jgi:hypothetical protein